VVVGKVIGKTDLGRLVTGSDDHRTNISSSRIKGYIARSISPDPSAGVSSRTSCPEQVVSWTGTRAYSIDLIPPDDVPSVSCAGSGSGSTNCGMALLPAACPAPPGVPEPWLDRQSAPPLLNFWNSYD
jgi:hypothetical protein